MTTEEMTTVTPEHDQTPTSGTVLPARPIPIPLASAPSEEHTRLIVAQLDKAYADAFAAGAYSMRARMLAGVDRLEAIATEHAERASRALTARDYQQAADQATAAAQHAAAAVSITRAITGDL